MTFFTLAYFSLTFFLNFSFLCARLRDFELIKWEMASKLWLFSSRSFQVGKFSAPFRDFPRIFLSRLSKSLLIFYWQIFNIFCVCLFIAITLISTQCSLFSSDKIFHPHSTSSVDVNLSPGETFNFSYSRSEWNHFEAKIFVNFNPQAMIFHLSSDVVCKDSTNCQTRSQLLRQKHRANFECSPVEVSRWFYVTIVSCFTLVW